MSVFHYTAIKFPSPYADGSDYPQGFIPVRFLKSHAVSLVYSPDDQKLYIRKIIRHNVYFPDEPPEIQFSNLATDSPFPVLPFLPVVVERSPLDKDDKVHGLILHAYNGGTQEKLVERFEAEKRPVPESYIWHVIEQTARAYAYLHFGHINGQKVGTEAWVSIVHRDGASNNIFLHFPDPHTPPRKNDTFIDAFPKVVLGDLGMANRVTDPEEQSSGGCFEQDGVNTWEDVVLFGEAIRNMLYTSTESVIGGDINSFPRLRAAGLTNLYSEDLIAALEPFEAPPDLDFWENDNAGILPSMSYVADVLLPQAIQKVKEYKQNGAYESVRWAQPQPIPFMPYVVRPEDKRGLRDVFATDYESNWLPTFSAVDLRFDATGMEIEEIDKSEYPECLQDGYDLTIPDAPFDNFDSVWAIANHADGFLKTAVKLAQKYQAENSGKDLEEAKDLALMKAARKVLRPVHHEADDTATSSSESTVPPPRKKVGSKSRLRSRYRGGRIKFSPTLKRARTRSRSTKAESEADSNAGLALRSTSRKRKRAGSTESLPEGKKAKGLPRLRETITTTTTRESF